MLSANARREAYRAEVVDRLPAKPLKYLMGQNVKSPFSNIHARTFKLYPCSTPITDLNRRNSVPRPNLHSLFAAPLSCGTAFPLPPDAISCLGALRRSPEHVVRSSLPAAENLHNSRREQMQQCVGRADYSITWSARASSVGGTSRPSIIAVAKLMTSSNLLACMTGRSAGFSLKNTAGVGADLTVASTVFVP